MIYTTYFAMLRKMPEDVVPIAVCARPPVNWDGLCVEELIPPYKDFQEWKGTGNNDKFAEQYKKKVLNRLEPEVVSNWLQYLAEGRDVALVCYEKSSDFCHRHLIREWLNEHGIACEEWK